MRATAASDGQCGYSCGASELNHHRHFGLRGLWTTVSLARYELNTTHAGGVAALAPLCSKRPDLPPLKLYGHQAEFQAANHGAFATLAARFYRMRGGDGQVIEISAQECLAAMLELSFVYYTSMGVCPSRLGGRLLGPWKIFDCRDGQILLACVEEHQWQSLVQLMGEPAMDKRGDFRRSTVARPQFRCTVVADGGLIQAMGRDGTVSRVSAAADSGGAG
jgi:crotonobetainyl-CoA:carnitine CoA-transferase CaiB-like acyl-CoA transferase